MWEQHKRKIVERRRMEQAVLEGFSVGTCLLMLGIMLILVK